MEETSTFSELFQALKELTPDDRMNAELCGPPPSHLPPFVLPEDLASDQSSTQEDLGSDWIPEEKESESEGLSEEVESNSELDDFIAWLDGECKHDLTDLVPESDNGTDDSRVVFPAVEVETPKQDEGSSTRSKQHCCKFCLKMNTKMSTHLQRCHMLEPEVALVLKMEKGDPERRKAFIKLQDQGDFGHNLRVLTENKGELIQKHKPKMGPRPATEYLACPYCKGLFLKTLLSKHFRHCPQKPDGIVPRRGHCAAQARMLLPLPQGVASLLSEKVVSKMKGDDIRRLVQADSLILKYGERLFSRRDIKEHSSRQISSRLRELGRLLSLLRHRSETKIATLTQGIDPSNFDLLTACIKELGQFSHSTNVCKKGSLVLKLGYSLTTCSHILKAEAIKTDDAVCQEKCERFQSLYAGDWFDSVSARASQSVQRAKMKVPKLLPSSADVEKVNNLMQKDDQIESYPTLVKATLASIVLFNRKRGGEVHRMTCLDFENRETSSFSPPEKEIMAEVTNTEKQLGQQLQRVEVRGKFNTPVPILLTPTMVQNIEELLSWRTFLGINSDHLFVTPSGLTPYRGPAALKEYDTKAAVPDSSCFTATALHKQLATLSQAMQVSKPNQGQLAAVPGHEIRTHISVCPQPLEITPKAKVTNILMKVDKGLQTTDFCSRLHEAGLEANEGVDKRGITTSDEADQDCDMELQGPGGAPENDSPVAVSQTTVQWQSLKRQSSGSLSNDSQVAVSQTQTAGSRPLPGQWGRAGTSAHQATRVTPEQRPRKPGQRPRKPGQRPWSKEETAAVKRHLNHCIAANKVPQKHEAEQARAAEPLLRHRNWKDVKYFVYNLLKKQCSLSQN